MAHVHQAMEDTRLSPAYRSLFLEGPAEEPLDRGAVVEKWFPSSPEPEVLQVPSAGGPEQTFAMKFFLYSISAICWTAVITTILVVFFFIYIIVMAAFHTM